MPIYKDKKRNTWYFRVYIYDNLGVKKQKCRSGFKTKNEAKIEERIFLSNFEQKKDTFGNFITKNDNKNNITFIELYNEFIKYKSQILKPQSIRSIKSRFNNHILPYFKNYRIFDIDSKLYINWKEQIISKNFKYKYNSGLHTMMVNILNYAIKFYNLNDNIASKIGNFSRSNYIKTFNFWTYEEFLKFISVIDDIKYYSLFYILFSTGLRIGECLSLTWKDFNRISLNINKTISKEKKNNNYIITSPKTYSSIRLVNLDNKSIEILENLKLYYTEYFGFSEEWYIFGGIKPLTRTTIDRKKNEYCKLANVKQIKIHEFRHSHASFLVSRGIPIPAISKRLGHADTSMTLNTYSHLLPEDEDKAINLINKINKEYNGG